MRKLACLVAMTCATMFPTVAHGQDSVGAPAAISETRLARQISAIMLTDGFLRDAYAALMPQVVEATIRARLGNAKFDAEKNDPVAQERTKRLSDITVKELGDLVSPYEQKLRVAYSAAYARQFDEQQLGEILTFYKTPVGTLFARRALALVGDPAIVSVQREISPVLTDALPKLQEKIKAAIADLSPNTAGAKP